MPSTPSAAADLRAGHLVGGLTGGQIPALHHLVAAPGEDGGGTPQPEMQLYGNKKIRDSQSWPINGLSTGGGRGSLSISFESVTFENSHEQPPQGDGPL